MATNNAPNGDSPSDEELRKLWKPEPTDEDALSALKSTFAAESTSVKILQSLESYDDRNYKVEMDGTPYLFKIHNGVESKDLIDMMKKNGNDYHACNNASVIHYQTAIQQHLNRHGVATSKPQLHQSAPIAVHSLAVSSSDHSPRELVLRLLSWVPGRVMSGLHTQPIESIADAGRFLGRMDATLDTLDADDYAASKRYHAWDGKNLLDLSNFTHCITNTRRRQMVQSVLDTFQTQIVDSGLAQQLRKGNNMADFNDANILCHDHDSRVCGVIDFGDAVESWRVLDLSVAAAYSMMSVYGKRGRSISALAAMVRGYNSVYPLLEVEMDCLHLFMACRLATSVTLGAYSYQQNPGNEYLLFHAEPGWAALELLWGHDETYRASMGATIRRVLDKACSYTPPPPNDKKDDLIDCTDLCFPDPSYEDILGSLRTTTTNGDHSSSSNKRKKPNPSANDSEKKKSITFVTGNKKKLEEVKRILLAGGGSDLPFQICNEKIDLPELQGDPLDIAKEKCATAAREIGGAVITEDTSLCFTALGGLPGPYIKWFLEKCGHAGLNNMLGSYEDKSAYAQTVVAFSPGPGKAVTVFDGRTMGKIVTARGKLDFGWDPVFEPDEGGGQTYAEMTKEAKDAISHRSRAFSQLRTYFIGEKDRIETDIS